MCVQLVKFFHTYAFLKHTQRERERERDRQTEREGDRPTVVQYTETQRHRRSNILQWTVFKMIDTVTHTIT